MMKRCMWTIVAVGAVAGDAKPFVPQHAHTLAPLDGVTNLNVVVLRWPWLEQLGEKTAMKFNPMYEVTKYLEKDNLGLLKMRLLDNAVVYLQRFVHKVRNFKMGDIDTSAIFQKFKDKIEATYEKKKDRYAEMIKLSFMTFDQVRDYYNITDAPTPAPAPVQCPVPRLVYQFQGHPYLYVPERIARLYQPYPGYTMHHFGQPTTVPLVPAIGYPWPWNSSITAITTLLEAADASANGSGSVTVGVMQAIDAIHKEFHIPTGLPLLPSAPDAPPTSPFSVLSLARTLPLRDALLQFYGYPKTSGFKAITTLTWYRSTVTAFTPRLANAVSAVSKSSADSRLRASYLKSLFDDAIDADIAGLIYGIESPSTAWLSILDRNSDEFADACLGELMFSSRTLPTAQAAFDKMTRRTEQKPLSASCLWDGFSPIHTAKMRSARKDPPKIDTYNVAAHVAVHVAARVVNLTATKTTFRKQRAETVTKVLQSGMEMPVSAMGSNGVVHLGPQTKQPCVAVEAIKEPEPLHAVQRVLVRVGESSLLSASEIDILYACVCLRVLGMHITNQVVECIAR